jgi:hypothetical protein
MSLHDAEILEDATTGGCLTLPGGRRATQTMGPRFPKRESSFLLYGVIGTHPALSQSLDSGPSPCD